MTVLPSIYDITDYEMGGRIARAGFLYQDHVGIKFLLRLLKSKNECDIFYETEDDIVLVEKDGTVMTVEMIQVKSNNLDARWSVSQLIDLEVLQKSLARGRCKEDVKYKVVTSYDVNDDLEVLKFDIGSSDRTLDKIDSLLKVIEKKKNDIPTNAKGQGIHDWVNNCIWEKLPDTIESLKSENILELEGYLYDSSHLALLPDQKMELYQKLLAFVQELSTTKKNEKVNKKILEDWLDAALENFSPPKNGTEKMVNKMEVAKIETSYIETAKQMRWDFRKEILNHFFVSQNVMSKVSREISSELENLKLSLDSGDLKIDGPSFHKLCLDRVSAIAKTNGIEETYAKGCMYDVTNRCLHRFIKASA